MLIQLTACSLVLHSALLKPTQYLVDILETSVDCRCTTGAIEKSKLALGPKYEIVVVDVTRSVLVPMACSSTRLWLLMVKTL